jgi:hypothetical protein
MGLPGQDCHFFVDSIVLFSIQVASYMMKELNHVPIPMLVFKASKAEIGLQSPFFQLVLKWS